MTTPQLTRQATPNSAAPSLHADVQRLLAGYATADEREAAFLAQMRAVSARGAAALQRDHWQPGHFTASAFVLSPDAAQLLLIHHRKLQRWLQPGGHLEPFDTSVDAACRREVAEETGVTALQPLRSLGQGGAGATGEVSSRLFDVDVHRIPGHGEQPAHLHLDLRMAYRAEAWGVVDTGEVEAVCWVPLDEVAGFETDASVLRAVARLLALQADSERSSL